MTVTPTFELENDRKLTAAGRSRRGSLGVAKGRALYYAPRGISSTGTPTQGVLALAPLDIDRVCVLTALIGEVTTLGSANAVIKLALYDDDGSLTFPRTLISDGGTDASPIDATGTGVKTATLASPLMLPPGRYWIGGVSQGAPVTPPVLRTQGNSSIEMPSTTASLTALNYGASQASVTGSLPTTFTTTVGYTFTVPRVGARLT